MQNTQSTKALGIFSNGDDPIALISLRGRVGFYTADGLQHLISEYSSKQSELMVLRSALDNLNASKYCRLSELDEDAFSGQASLL